MSELPMIGVIRAIVRIVPTPKGCEMCLHRNPESRDGGWCYMFREMPPGSCAQFKFSMDQAIDSAVEAARKEQA